MCVGALSQTTHEQMIKKGSVALPLSPVFKYFFFYVFI